MSNMIVIIFVAVVIVVYIPWLMRHMNKTKRSAADFAAQNPTTARVVLVGMITGAITVNSVDEKPPVFFQDGVKSGFFLLPGEHVINVEYTWSRPGVIHKSVTTTVGPVNIKVTAETGKSYRLEYHKNEERYEFSEV